jgi:hypothetical protein
LSSARAARVKTEAGWLYFEPRGARQFAALLMDMADEAEAAAGVPETTGEVHGTGDAPSLSVSTPSMAVARRSRAIPSRCRSSTFT